MAELPRGTVTFLFTDIEGSTRRWEHDPDRMRAALARHDVLLAAAIEQHEGVVVKARGEGDSIFAVFDRATDAADAAISIQKSLSAEVWPTTEPIRVRMALHTGEAELRDGDYYGAAVNRCARLRAAGHGGQILLSRSTFDLIRDAPPAGVSLISLGEFRLKDLIRSEHVFQLTGSGLPSEFPPLRTLDLRANNLPVQRSPLIGREQELADLQRMLLRDDVGLVTLTGPGGTGKTRLSLQVAADVIEQFEDGAFFVGLAPISDPSLMAPTIALALGIETGNRPALDSLKDYCQERRLLLILDNFEQLLAAAPIVADLLRASAGLKIVVTSRAALRIRGETEFPVPPLALPNPKMLPAPTALAQFAAVALFIERATAIRPDFAVTNENAPAVAEICARLDGLPLAIELAAARIRLLTPSAMLVRLDRRLPLLAGGARDLPARQQTLRSAIAWSHDLLDEAERVLFRRLGVFVGGCTIEAAEAVCADVGDQDRISVFDGIETLVSQSLLRQEEGQDGEPRVLMLETIREFALEQLDAAGETDSLRRQHATFFLDLAERADAQLSGPQQLRWLQHLDAEHDNLRAALNWSAAQPDERELAGRLVVSLTWFWHVRGHPLEMREWPTRVLACWPDSDRSLLRGRVLTRCGMAGWQQGDFIVARAWFEESLAIFGELGAIHDRALALFFLGNVVLATGERAGAEACYDECLTAYRQAGHAWGIGLALQGLGLIALLRDDLEAGEAHLEASLSSMRRAQDAWGSAHALNLLGDLARRQGDYERAGIRYDEGLACFRSLGTRGPMASLLHNLGYVALYRQDAQRAGEIFRESLSLFRDAGDKRGLAECMAGLAAVAAVGAQPERAAHLFGASEALLESIGARLSASNLDDYERNVATARKGHDASAFAVAWSAGRAMTPEQAVAHALETPELT
ncbi:MAG: adenylate/guanylate cyclase domain-containing protein [Chloroflexota bacterium]